MNDKLLAIKKSEEYNATNKTTLDPQSSFLIVTPLGAMSGPQSTLGLAWRRRSGNGLPAKRGLPLGHHA